jgi:hypothetical protein
MTINLVIKTRLAMVGVGASDLKRIRAIVFIWPTKFPISIFSLV